MVGKMVNFGRMKIFYLIFSSLFSYVLATLHASHLEGSLEVFFPNEITTISLATSGTFCIAKPNADPNLLKSGLDWACGPGSANCGPIQPGQPCFVANNIVALASYAYNSYYQANQAKGATCNFGNTAMLTNTDPSSGSCIFPGSTGSGTNPGGSANPSGPPPPPGGFGTPPGGSGSPPGSPGTPPGSPGAPPSGTGFTPSFQPTYNDSDDAGMLGLNLVYLSPYVVLSLFIM